MKTSRIPSRFWTVLCLSVVTWTSVCECKKDEGEPPYFKAAVFEHRRLGNVLKDQPSEIIRMNLEVYERATRAAKKQDVDLIVFPEYGLFPELPRAKNKATLETVPDPVEKEYNPCLQRYNGTMLYTLSCMARKYDIVIVANMGDKQPCVSGRNRECPKDGVFLYNANVAFGRDGTVLSRYRKEHLFFEPAMDVPTDPQFPVFFTDFGSIAMYVCFDSVFKPMADMARRYNVDAIVLPTEWMDMLPQLDAVAYWQAWAAGNNITLLVANGQYPYQGSAGSGIFSGNLGPLQYTYNPDGLSKLVISRVPRKRFQSPPFPNPDAGIMVVMENGTVPFYKDGQDVPDYCLRRMKGGGHHLGSDYRCNQEDTAAFSFVKLTKDNDSLSLYNNGMYCSVEYLSSQLVGKNESYYLGLNNGTHNVLNTYFFAQEMCFVFRCDEGSGPSCSVFPLRSNTVFDKLVMRANFTTGFVYPTAVHSGMRLIPKNQWSSRLQKVSGGGSYSGHIEYTGDGSSPLLTLGLYGRVYHRDPPYSHKRSHVRPTPH